MKVRYVQFEISEQEHRQLKLLCIHRGCTLKSMLQEAVAKYVQNAPELHNGQQEEQTGEDAHSYGGMELGM